MQMLVKPVVQEERRVHRVNFLLLAPSVIDPKMSGFQLFSNQTSAQLFENSESGVDFDLQKAQVTDVLVSTWCC